MPTDPKLVREHFFVAAELPAAEREAYLAVRCGGDAELRAAVERLLAAHDEPASVLNRPVPGEPEHTKAYIASEQPGTVVAGRYKLLEAIGEGGMGAVWVAEQTQPVRRRVALKLIKTGMDSKSVLARFEAERQALAVMDHPNIAKVLDGGLTETGRPFFVMEYVKGVPITEYCDATRLSIPERLNLFVQVCQAVQHAHQKGIIHRDLKPSNILVAPYDDKPVPKVIDFGLAKAMHQSLTDRTLHTAHETVLGTPLYMSPEQAQLNNLDVDTRSDIYSLGVLLYEMLTGTTPLEKQRFKAAAWDEIRRIIREEEPPRPSTRLSSSQTLPSLAAGRHTEPARLTKLVRGDLDWIVMKSLEKDRARRYETANGFAMDIQRYLAGEPVLAVPPSARYRLRKFARKNRGLLATIGAFAFVLIATTAFSTWQAYRASNAESVAQQSEAEAIAERNTANTARDAEGVARRNAEDQRLQAEANFKKAREAVDEYFTKVSESKLLNVPGLQPLRKELLESARRYYQEFLLDHAKDPSVRAEAAEAWYRVGFVTMYINPGRETLDAFQKAADMYDRLAREQPDVERFTYKLAMCLNDLGNQHAALGQETEAYKTHERCLAIRQQVVREHPDVPEYLKELGIGYLVWANRQYTAGLTSDSRRSNEQARDIFERLVREYPDVADYQRRLGGALGDIGKGIEEMGRPDEAMPLFLQALALAERLDREHPNVIDNQSSVISSLSRIAWSHYRLSDRNDDALAAYRKAKALAEKVARDNPDLMTARVRVTDLDHEIARVLVRLGRLDEALTHYQSVLEYEEKQRREDSGSVWNQRELGYLHFEIGRLHRAAGREPEALESLAKARIIFEALAGEQALDPYNRACVQALSAGLVGLGESDLSPEEQAKRRTFSERAVATLRQAAAGGHHSPAMISSDIDFEAIRSREDFQELVKELKAKASKTPAVAPRN